MHPPPLEPVAVRAFPSSFELSLVSVSAAALTTVTPRPVRSVPLVVSPPAFP
jgi:hypothetical protein